MTIYKALEDVQRSQGFSIPHSDFVNLVMNNRRLIESQLRFSSVMVFTLRHNPVTVNTGGNWYTPVNYHMMVDTHIG